MDSLIRDLSKDDKELLTFSGTEPDIFRLYIQWLYHNKLPCQSSATLDPNTADNAEYLHLAKAYVLGHVLEDPRFRHVVLGALEDKNSPNQARPSCWLPLPWLVDYIYNEGYGFPALQDVPTSVLDWQTNREVPVEMDMLRMIYEVVSDRAI